MMLLISKNNRYSIYQNDDNKYSVYLIDGKYEYCISRGNYQLEDAKFRVDNIEKYCNFDELLIKKIKQRKEHSEFIRDRNLKAIQEGNHQFQINPEIQGKGVEAASKWAKENPKIKHDITSRAANIKWSDPEHNEKMYKVLKDNNDSGKTAQGMREMLDDPIRRESFVKNESDSAKKNWQDDEYRRKVINGLITAAKEGDWRIPYTRALKGWYHSNKNNDDFYYRSSYELATYKFLETNELVKKYDTECIRVEYLFEGKIHITVPDALVEFVDSKRVIIEVKTEYFLSDLKTIAKIEAVKEYAKNNNLGFLLLTEKELRELGIL